MFRALIDAMNSSNVFGIDKASLAIELLNKSGIVWKPGQNRKTTVNSWIRRGVPENTKVYFPYRKVDEEAILRFLREGAQGNRWLELQKAFEKTEGYDEILTLIDCQTKSEETFYQSVLKQWIVSLRLPLSDDIGTTLKRIMEETNMDGSGSEKQPEQEQMSKPQLESKQISELYKNNFVNFGVKGFIEYNPLHKINSGRIEDMIHFVYRIRHNEENRNAININKKVCRDIEVFTEIMDKYIQCLQRSNKPYNAFPEEYELTAPDIVKFAAETNGYRQKLNDLYATIDEAIKKEYEYYNHIKKVKR